MMHSGATALAQSVAIVLVLGLSGCGGSGGSAPVVPPPPTVASVTVAPPSATIAPGLTQQLSATARDSSGNSITGVGFTWNSDATSVATVDTHGLATALNQEIGRA